MVCQLSSTGYIFFKQMMTTGPAVPTIKRIRKNSHKHQRMNLPHERGGTEEFFSTSDNITWLVLFWCCRDMLCQLTAHQFFERTAAGLAQRKCEVQRNARKPTDGVLSKQPTQDSLPSYATCMYQRALQHVDLQTVKQTKCVRRHDLACSCDDSVRRQQACFCVYLIFGSQFQYISMFTQSWVHPMPHTHDERHSTARYAMCKWAPSDGTYR